MRAVGIVSTIAVSFACGASHSAIPTGPSQQSLTQSAVNAFLPPGQKAPPPNAFQLAILAKKTLTFADYQTAMQAAADCTEKAVPGEVATVAPQGNNPQLLTITLSKGAGPTAGAAGTGLSQSNPPGAGSQAYGSSSTPSSTATGTGTSTTETTAVGSAGPPGAQALNEQFGTCLALYAAEVQARWIAQLSLSGSQMTTQRPEFLACMIAAGVQLSSKASYAQISNLLHSPSWPAKLSKSEQDKANACLKTYANFVNTLS